MKSILRAQTIFRTLNMFEDFTLTSCAPALRFTNGQLEKQSAILLKNRQFISVFESISQMVVVLNQHRQIIYANKSFYEFTDSKNSATIGQRPGESFNCSNSVNNINGCGTSKFCKNCGALKSIFKALKGVKSTEDCRILTDDNDAIDLRVTATPMKFENEKFTIFSLTDISSEKRRISLERVFIHDILNSAGAISGLSSIVSEIDDMEEIKTLTLDIQTAANNLIEEIRSQREFAAAERGELSPNLNAVLSTDILTQISRIYSGHEINVGTPVVVNSKSEEFAFITDPVLLKRILSNMIKNAIEVNLPDDEITLHSYQQDGKSIFSVHNKGYIPEDIQAELFRRFFSTKGNGRGLGTYSMKLFGEKHLGGRVWFESSEQEGTTFFIKL